MFLKGHSFEKSCGWPAQYKVEPKCVVLPPCLPPMPVYNTFVIYHYGHLPLAFKFLPPQDT